MPFELNQKKILGLFIGIFILILFINISEKDAAKTTEKEEEPNKVPVKDGPKDEMKMEVQDSVKTNNESSSKKITVNQTISETLSRNKIGRYSTVVMANYGHLDFLLNFQIAFNKAVKPEEWNRFTVIALDRTIYNSLSGNEMSVILATDILVELDLPKDEVTWKSSDYNKVTNAKVAIALILIRDYKIDLLFSDADIVFTTRVMYDYFDQFYDRYDFLISSDKFGTDQNICTGFYMAKSSAFTIDFFTKIAEAKHDKNDQFIANDIFNSLPASSKLKIHILPALLFPNGNMIKKGVQENFNVNPWIIHANYAIGKKKKVEILKRRGFWFIE